MSGKTNEQNTSTFEIKPADKFWPVRYSGAWVTGKNCQYEFNVFIGNKLVYHSVDE